MIILGILILVVYVISLVIWGISMAKYPEWDISWNGFIKLFAKRSRHPFDYWRNK